MFPEGVGPFPGIGAEAAVGDDEVGVGGADFLEEGFDSGVIVTAEGGPAWAVAEGGEEALGVCHEGVGGITREVADDENAIGFNSFVLVGLFVGRAKDTFELINFHGGILPDLLGESRLGSVI